MRVQSNEDPPARYQSVPFVAEFEGADDAVILAYKVVDDRVYLYGTTAAKMISFVSPKPGKEVDEAKDLLPRNMVTGGDSTALEAPIHNSASYAQTLYTNKPGPRQRRTFARSVPWA